MTTSNISPLLGSGSGPVNKTTIKSVTKATPAAGKKNSADPASGTDDETTTEIGKAATEKKKPAIKDKATEQLEDAAAVKKAFKKIDLGYVLEATNGKTKEPIAETPTPTGKGDWTGVADQVDFSKVPASANRRITETSFNELQAELRNDSSTISERFGFGNIDDISRLPTSQGQFAQNGAGQQGRAGNPGGNGNNYNTGFQGQLNQQTNVYGDLNMGGASQVSQSQTFVTAEPAVQAELPEAASGGFNASFGLDNSEIQQSDREDREAE